jgi:hypothetical protein
MSSCQRRDNEHAQAQSIITATHNCSSAQVLLLPLCSAHTNRGMHVHSENSSRTVTDAFACCPFARSSGDRTTLYAPTHPTHPNALAAQQLHQLARARRFTKGESCASSPRAVRVTATHTVMPRGRRTSPRLGRSSGSTTAHRAPPSWHHALSGSPTPGPPGPAVGAAQLNPN